jgi:hypothetical protein
MPLEERQLEKLRRHTRGLMEEARTYMTGPPDIWGVAIDRWSKLNTIKMENNIWLANGKAESFSVDLLVFHAFPTTMGRALAVQPYDNLQLGATEFMITLEKSIPTAFYTRISSGLKAVRWYSPKAAADAFIQKYVNALNEVGALTPPLTGDLLSYANHWTQKVKSITFMLPYTMQLVPLDEKRTLFLFKRSYDDQYTQPYARIYHVGEFLLLAQNLSTFLEDFQLPANFIVKPELPIPTWSVLTIPELAPALPSQGQKFDLPGHGAEPYMHLHEGLSPTEGFRQSHREDSVQCDWCKQWFLPTGGRCPYCDHRI